MTYFYSDNTSMFWNNVKSLLKNSPFTQKSLSEYLGYSPRTLEQWISRNSLPNASDAVKIAQALSTSVEFLVTGKDSNIYKEKYDVLVAAIKELPVSWFSVLRSSEENRNLSIPICTVQYKFKKKKINLPHVCSVSTKRPFFL